MFSASACSRSRYTQWADAQAYKLVNSRLTDPRWSLPARTVEPARASRMELVADLDCAPKPADDPAAVPLMVCPDGHRNDRYWSKIPTVERIESPAWLEYLPRNEQGEIVLSQHLAMDLALLHSRDYQTEFENVYLTGLALTGNQFEFSTQWLGGVGTQFTAVGDDLGGGRILQVSDRLGFGRQLAGGGQFATNILNSLFWDFGTGGVSGGSGQIVSTFTQPLLRGAFRHVRLESLTQAERQLLYEVRDFARFRRQFYLQIVSNYLSLLTQVQSIRNAATNLESLRLNLVEHQELLALKMVSQIQVDQVFQDYQNGRLSLLAAEQGLAASLDQFKFQLGLPSWVQLKIDESLLAPFELTDPRLAGLERDAQALYQSLLQFLPPEVASRQTLLDAFEPYQKLQGEVETLLPQILEELAKLKAHIKQGQTSAISTDDKLDFDQQAAIADRIGTRLNDLKTALDKHENSDKALFEQLNRYDKSGDSNTEAPDGKESTAPQPSASSVGTTDVKPPEVLAWESLLAAIGRGLREEIAELAIAQTQIRLFLITIEPLNVDERSAISFAQQNRLDQMNRKAQVMDGFRKIEVAADLLESQLNVSGQAILGTDPNHNNAYRFDSSANSYRVGVQFDGPLNRLNERNVYRASQIAYQQATRNYVAGKDQVANEVRSALRQLNLRRLNFQIARQQLVAATRQVDEAQINLRTATQSSTNLTRDLLQSLQGQLNAKNNLIFNWIDYKIAKIRL